MSIDVTARLVKLYARTTDRTLADSLRTVATTEPTPESALVHGWIIKELERRHPEVDARMDAVFATAIDEQDRTGKYVNVDYVETLLGLLGL